MQTQKENKLSLAHIQQVIDREILPLLQSHGGGITQLRLEDDVLHFRLSGQCCGCPSAWLTTEELIRTPLINAFPSLRDVVADTDLDDEMVALAKDVLSGRLRFN